MPPGKAYRSALFLPLSRFLDFSLLLCIIIAINAVLVLVTCKDHGEKVPRGPVPKPKTAKDPRIKGGPVNAASRKHVVEKRLFVEALDVQVRDGWDVGESARAEAVGWRHDSGGWR